MLIAYHDNPDEKVAILAQLAAHREADELIQGREYWRNGKGCAVGCTLHSGEHMEYEVRFGIPVMLAHLEDEIFEGLPNDSAQMWPERFMGAVKPGADLSRVGWRLLHWLLTDPEFNPGVKHSLVSDAVNECANVIAPLCDGREASELVTAEKAALRAGRMARSARWITASEAWSAESASDAAWSVVNAAKGDADRAGAAAAWAVRSASRSRSAAWGEGAAWEQIGDKLIDLIECT